MIETRCRPLQYTRGRRKRRKREGGVMEDDMIGEGKMRKMSTGREGIKKEERAQEKE